MRYADKISKDGFQYKLCEGVNILTVKIASSAIGFPIHVYGTVIARDSIDRKCIYLFRRDRDCCQLIDSEDDSLILTGPKRGIVLIEDNDAYVEIDLKVKDDGGQDIELSKGYIKIRAMAHRLLRKCEVETKFLATRLSTVHVMYAVVKDARREEDIEEPCPALMNPSFHSPSPSTWPSRANVMHPLMGADSMTELQRLAEVEKLRQELVRVAENFDLLARREKNPAMVQKLALVVQRYRADACVVDYDPKQGGRYYNRINNVNRTDFNIDEESPLGPMRYTDRISGDEHQYKLCEGVNIFTIKIASSDIGFPIHVYGTVIARDDIDLKCIYLFRRDRNCCQVINSEDDSLILTGPKRGISLIDNNDAYVEIDLKVKDDGGQDRDLSKGYIEISGMAHELLRKYEVENKSLATRLSTVDVIYAVVKDAVEGTVAIEVPKGIVFGEITAHTTSINNSLVLYDSKVVGGNGDGVLPLMRPVVCVDMREILCIVFHSRDGNHEHIIKFTPRHNGREDGDIFIDGTKMHVEVTWSTMSGDSMTELQRLAEVEKLRREMLHKADKFEQLIQQEKDLKKAQELARLAQYNQDSARVIDFDPKQNGCYCNRVDLPKVFLDEESPYGPMRYTDSIGKDGRQYRLHDGVNIFTIKIASSDIGFPIHVYGTVIARDGIDHMCIYLFRRDRNCCQLINSEDDSLILTGPKRGIALIDDSYVEIDLKVKDDGGHDRELSKGYISIRGTVNRLLSKCVVETESLATRLSTVDVMYAIVKDAMEGTVAIEVSQGFFWGEITAHTTSINNSIVLYDSKVTSGNGSGVLTLMRSVVCVYLKEMLCIVFHTRDAKHEYIIKFTPRCNGREADDIFVDGTKMHVEVAWSIIDH